MAERRHFEILVLNNIAQVGLKRLPAERYRIDKEAAHPDAILLRSQDLHAMKIALSVGTGIGVADQSALINLPNPFE